MVKMMRKIRRWLGRRMHDRKAKRLNQLDAHSSAAAEQIFTHIYANNVWGDDESVSGVGSNLEQTAILRDNLPSLLRELGVRTLLDVPCGDFHWLSHTKLGVDRYIGADIVADLIHANQQRYQSARPAISFVQMNLLEDDLGRHDLILCRDCLVHFSNEHVRRALKQIAKSGSTYLLTTTYPGRVNERDIATGQWRALNLEAAPFSLPKPLTTIVEGCTERRGRFPDKALGLWKINATASYLA